jgi:hypothetical protein
MRRLLDLLAAQTIAAEIEVVLVDTRPWMADIGCPSTLHLTVLPGSTLTFGQARAAAARAARSDIVAFLEDHCYPETGWAEALADAYRGSWVSVGYALANANPETRISRITHLANYGQWESPLPGRTAALPGNNVSYRREVLLDLGPDLATMLMADHNLHARLRRRGLAFATAPGARVRHENPVTLTDACRGSACLSRVLAAERARFEGWGTGHRLARAVMIVGSAPLVRLAGLLGATRRRPRRLLRVAVYLPAILAEYLSSALGESLGYLVGSGRGAARVMYWEVDAPRAAEP